MQMSPITFYTLNAFSIVSMLVIVGVAGYFLLTTGVDDTAVDAKRMAEVAQLQTRAGVYHSRLQYYDGVCTSIGVADRHPCYESASAYATGQWLTDSTFYCADSTGYRGPARILTPGETVCARP